MSERGARGTAGLGRATPAAACLCTTTACILCMSSVAARYRRQHVLQRGHDSASVLPWLPRTTALPSSWFAATALWPAGKRLTAGRRTAAAPPLQQLPTSTFHAWACQQLHLLLAPLNPAGKASQVGPSHQPLRAGAADSGVPGLQLDPAQPRAAGITTAHRRASHAALQAMTGGGGNQPWLGPPP